MFNDNQIISVKWSSNNKKHYISKGYHYTYIGDEFFVPAKDMPLRSRMNVICICDYCGRQYQTRYANYNIGKDCGKQACKQCKQLKIRDTLLRKYNSTSLWGNKELRAKAKESMISKYGKPYAMQTKIGQEKFKNSMIKNYGVDNPVKSDILQAKAKKSMYKNGTVPTSKPEQKIINMLIQLYGKENCKPGYPVDKINLDCLLILNNVKIDVEYDGVFWHKDMKDYDRRRNHWLINQGYKVLRILGDKKDSIPTIERLQQEIDYLLAGHSIGYIDMMNNEQLS